jgi:hypothetical protein
VSILHLHHYVAFSFQDPSLSTSMTFPEGP